ncbi:sensor histidine kinase [Massilia sp. PWRC2]|uniref:sensor histidine kinase n=1 Tax=Massilia sp. PWRC2 TaxID=2804626 RepID=UPI003CF0A8A4
MSLQETSRPAPLPLPAATTGAGATARRGWIAALVLLLLLLLAALAALVDSYEIGGPAAYANGIGGSASVVRAARWFDAGADGAAGSVAITPPDATVMAQRGLAVALPHLLAKTLAQPTINWYRMTVQIAAPVPGAVAAAACVPRWSSSASVWIDGKQLIATAGGGNVMNDWSRPQFIALPPDLAAGPHQLDVRLRALPALAPGLSEIWIGDGPLIRTACATLAEQREARILGSGLLIGMMGLAGVLTALLFGDAAAACFALMAMLWVAQLALSRGLSLGLGEQHWTLLFIASRTAFVPPMMLFCLRIAQLRRPRLERTIVLGYGAALALLLALAPQQWARWLTMVALLLILALPYFLAQLVRHALRTPTISGAVLAAAIVFVMVSNVLDIMRWAGAAPYSSGSLSILSMPMLSLAFGALLFERLVGYARSEMVAAETLRLTVAHQAERIAADFAVLKAQGERLVVLEERRRIARDMHDGVGSHLVSVSALLKSGRAMGQSHIAGLVDGALHELRGVLDVLSAEPAIDGDDDPVSTLLGSLRWRVAPVLESQGIELEWQADSLPADFLPGDAARLHLLRLLQEGFTNIVKHAGASKVRFRSAIEDGVVVIELCDNGCGMAAADDAALPCARGLGLGGMRQRAALMRASFELRACAPGTGIYLRFAGLPPVAP